MIRTVLIAISLSFLCGAAFAQATTGSLMGGASGASSASTSGQLDFSTPNNSAYLGTI